MRPSTRGESGIVEPSSELKAVAARIFAAINERDSATFLSLCADEPGVLFIEQAGCEHDEPDGCRGPDVSAPPVR